MAMAMAVAIVRANENEKVDAWEMLVNQNGYIKYTRRIHESCERENHVAIEAKTSQKPPTNM